MVSEEGDSTPLAQDKFFGYVKTDFQAVYASEGAWCPKTRVFSLQVDCPALSPLINEVHTLPSLNSM